MPDPCPPGPSTPGTAPAPGTKPAATAVAARPRTVTAARPRTATAAARVPGSQHGRMRRSNGLDAIRAARGVERALFPFSDVLGMRVVAAAPGGEVGCLGTVTHR
ncbi:hypothetical protein [Kitasatospora sp. NPDC057198]|uniref:hypothetical protein n=1 Tax=Kitasatospora sp. NPDC057198 TaxID=3346046 RepID=UPI00364566D2